MRKVLATGGLDSVAGGAANRWAQLHARGRLLWRCSYLLAALSGLLLSERPVSGHLALRSCPSVERSRNYVHARARTHVEVISSTKLGLKSGRAIN